MARKSRKNINQTDEELVPSLLDDKITLLTGAYSRLSTENSGHENDETLVTQKMLLRQYIEKHPDLTLYDEYVDNGHTGTDFDRHDFMRMMEDVRNGKIQCIVVKDLSRFGRNYLEMGYYLETYLPKMNVRVIAITDDFDSSRPEDMNSLSVPIKNLVNEMYAKDLSKKLCASYQARKSRKESFKNGNPAYGYLFDADKNQFIVDENVAPYVRIIFYWLRKGLKTKAIVDRVNLLGIDTPGKYKNVLAGKEVFSTQNIWRQDTIQKMLQNPSYNGSRVSGRHEAALYKSQKSRLTAPDEWLVIEKAHEPLVRPADYDIIREIVAGRNLKTPERSKREEKYREMYKDYFPKMIKCGTCGRIMTFRRVIHNYNTLEKVCGCYDCPNEPGKVVYDDYLKIVVADQIRNLVLLMCEKKKLLKKMQTDDASKNIIQAVKVKKTALRKKLSQAEHQLTTLYENYCDNMIDTDTYQELKAAYTANVEKLKSENQTLDQQLRYYQKIVTTYTELVNDLEKTMNDMELTPEIVEQFISSITVSSNGGLSIVFKVDDILRTVDEILYGGDTI